MDQERTAYLELASWRRRVAALYAEVRALAAADPAGGVAHWRAVREDLYRTHPQSPVPFRERATFRAQHFPYDPVLRFDVPVLDRGEHEPRSGPSHDAGPRASAPAPQAVAIPASVGDTLVMRRLGWVDIPFPAGTRRLALFWMEGYAGGLYLPFGDATNGDETYGAGRYLLDGAKSADLGGDPARGTLILDFNFAYHPSCAFDPRWACPLTPPENRLDLGIRAGERLSHA
jgi:uncharacterized protein (DUF1684 family)